jgi:arylsulfatase A-like enzyme
MFSPRPFAALVACLGLTAAVPAADERPSFLLAIGDNWAWPHAGALADPAVRTPAFDRIAREGVLFTHAFCPVPSCSPTRSSLLTGRAAHQLEDAASLWSAFPRKFRVFTELLRDAGYEVGFTGKGWSPGRFKESGWEENPVGRQFASFEEFMARRDPAKPFFFWLGNVDTALHKWRHEPDGWAGIDPARVVVPPMLPDAPEVRASILAYYGGVERMDRACGDAIAQIEKASALDRTVVVYTSDNGWQMPRGLANCHDTGTRIPLAVRWGAKLAAGRKADDFVSLTDLAPTFLELAGLKPPPEMTGRSFADVLLGRPSAVVRDHVFVERERHANVRRGNLSYPVRGVRTRDFLYLRNLRPDRWPAGDPERFFAVGDFGDVDNSKAKEFILAHRDDAAAKKFFELSFAKRPAEEL